MHSVPNPTTRRVLLLAAMMGAALLSACVVRGGAYFQTEPQLVEVGPGIWVVEDYDEPVFYSDGVYWRYYGGTWYRSRSYNNGWVIVDNRVVPHAVFRIDRPRSYVHYHGRPGAVIHRGPPDRRAPRRNERVPARRGHEPQPAVRDHRSRPQPQVRDHRSQPAPATRDHRRDKPEKKRGHDHR